MTAQQEAEREAKHELQVAPKTVETIGEASKSAVARKGRVRSARFV
jgi:hypothetical protein